MPASLHFLTFSTLYSYAIPKDKVILSQISESVNLSKFKSFIYFFLFGIILLLSGCQIFSSDDDAQENQEGYYSIKGFLDDQWNIIGGTPIVLLKVANFNGHADSSFVPLDSTLWSQIRAQFDPSDISAQRFLDQYKFSSFSDETTSTVFLNYEAKLPELFTRQLQVGYDNSTQKIESIYIETEKKSRTYTKVQKLTYLPREAIQIQNFEKSIISRKEDINISYYFKY